MSDAATEAKASGDPLLLHKCRSCGKPIYWTTTDPGGKAMPVDAEPSDQGQFVINQRGRARNLIAIHISNLAPDAIPGRRRWASHFATCPNAKEHRKP